MESSSKIRPAYQLLSLLDLSDIVEKIGGWGPIPAPADVGLTFREQV